MIGFSELGVIFLVVLLIFGASRIPSIGAAFGKGIRNFRKALKGEDEIDVAPTHKIETKGSKNPE